MTRYPILEELYDTFGAEFPNPPTGKELTLLEIQQCCFIAGFKLGLQVAAEALI